MKAYMSRRANGTYILSHQPPVVCQVGRTDRKDLYFVPGDAFCVRDLCEWQAEHIFEIVDLPPLQTQRVEVCGSKYGSPQLLAEHIRGQP